MASGSPFQMAEIEQRLSLEVGIMLYRILQESLHNIGKHANAKNVTISLTNHPHCLNFSIMDDGQGFDPEEVEAGLWRTKAWGC